MAYNILFTSLYAAGKDEPLRYYYASNGEKRLYTDAMLTVEATTKYILSRYHIDEVLVLGRNLTFDAGDDKRVLGVDDGKPFYDSDIDKLSTYSLFRYRLSQFKDDLKIEHQAVRELLSPEEQKQTEEFLKIFSNRNGSAEGSIRFGRFFDRLVHDAALYEKLKKELTDTIPESADRWGDYLKWIKSYLYMNLKDSSKLEILESNENAKIRFVPTEVDEGGKLPIDTLLKLSRQIASEEIDAVDIYIALNNDDMTDNFVMLGVLDIIDALYGSNVNVVKVCTATDAHFHLAGMIRDDTEGYRISSLTTAINAFLQYGKADMIIDYWEHSFSKNSQIEKMIYAMRRIDIGLSLCCISDIEKGIRDLRELYRNGFDLSGSDYYSKLFILLSEGIKKDYGRLLTADDAGFIDLVKWACSNGFYQQCLTLIEAKAPADMVIRGIFYYCADENDKQHVVDIFARARNMMRSNEYWKMDDMDHYFVKSYIHFKHPPTTLENQRENARGFVAILDNTDPNRVTGYSACEDRQALEDLLFAYLHIGRVRNDTNHANTGSGDNGSLLSDEKDASVKLVQIQESIRYFIESYDTVLNHIAGKKPVVVRITADEVKAAARRIERAEKEKRDGQNTD